MFVYVQGVLADFNNLLLPVEEFVNINRRAVIKDMPALVSIHVCVHLHLTHAFIL